MVSRSSLLTACLVQYCLSSNLAACPISVLLGHTAPPQEGGGGGGDLLCHAVADSLLQGLTPDNQETE